MEKGKGLWPYVTKNTTNVGMLEISVSKHLVSSYG